MLLFNPLVSAAVAVARAAFSAAWVGNLAQLDASSAKAVVEKSKTPLKRDAIQISLSRFIIATPL